MPTIIKPTRIKAPAQHGVFAARGTVVSPYFPRAGGTYKTTYMKAIAGLDYGVSGTGVIGVGFYTGSTLTDAQNLSFDMADSTDPNSLIAAAEVAINAYATAQGYTLSEGIYWPFPYGRTFNSPSLAVNTSRQASTLQDAQVSASVDITTTLSLSGGSAGKVALQYADNTGFTTNVVTVQSYTNSNTGTLTLGLNTSQIGTASLTGIIPAGKYYRLVTTNITGTPTYGTPVIQEVLL